MRFHVAQLLQEPVGANREHDICEPPRALSPDLDLRGPLTGRVHLLRTGQGILATAQLETTVQLSCGRCLTEFEAPLALSFTEEYTPSIDINTGLPVPAPPDEAAFRIDQRHILDLTEAVRQYALVGLPLKPLCSQECAGLCPQCGHNLNLGPCACENAPGDEGRLAAGLKEWLTRQQDRP